jgi:hypothetical protein
MDGFLCAGSDDGVAGIQARRFTALGTPSPSLGSPGDVGQRDEKKFTHL